MAPVTRDGDRSNEKPKFKSSEQQIVVHSSEMTEFKFENVSTPNLVNKRCSYSNARD